MNPDDSLGMAQVSGHLVHRQRRGVRDEQALLADDRVNLREHVLLDVHFLEHCFDHEVTVGERLDTRRCRHRAAKRSGNRRRLATPLHVSLQQPPDALSGGVRACLINFHHRDCATQPRREEQRDLRRHQAAAHHANAGNRQRINTFGYANRPLGPLRDEVERVNA